MHREKYNKLQLVIKKIFSAERKELLQPEQMLSASKEHPAISTLVYKSSDINFTTSETFPQDVIIANAKQLLVALDHTTASRH